MSLLIVVLLALALVSLICACLAWFGYDGRLLQVAVILNALVLVILLLGQLGLLHIGH